jgi:hypothetical protein
MSGEAELYYGIIIAGLCVPPFVHYALKFIREGLPEARRDLIAMKAAAKADLERTKEILRTRRPASGSLEELDMTEEDHDA